MHRARVRRAAHLERESGEYKKVKLGLGISIIDRVRMLVGVNQHAGRQALTRQFCAQHPCARTSSLCDAIRRSSCDHPQRLSCESSDHGRTSRAVRSGVASCRGFAILANTNATRSSCVEVRHYLWRWPPAPSCDPCARAVKCLLRNSTREVHTAEGGKGCWSNHRTAFNSVGAR